jgi:hypothetical protein
MTWLVPLLLACLAITDGGFAGFRDAAGRDARIFKAEFFRRAVRRGLRFGFVGVAISGALVAGAVLLAPHPQARLEELVAGGAWMLPVLAVYATAVLVALGVWSAAEADLRTLASVVILGPFTLIRPYVIAGAALLGAWKAGSFPAALVTIAVCGVQLALEPWMGRAWKTRPVHPERSRGGPGG